ncbi:MAG: YggT family protein [Acidimicrobiia bacterium]|nr:YggT family protein [Acidimicrobiia bacterium]
MKSAGSLTSAFSTKADLLGVICTLLGIYVWVVIGRIILEWIPVPGDHPVGQVRRVLAQGTDPVLMPLRRAIPPLRTGTIALDLSPIVLIIGLQIVQAVLCR